MDDLGRMMSLHPRDSSGTWSASRKGNNAVWSIVCDLYEKNLYVGQCMVYTSLYTSAGRLKDNTPLFTSHRPFDPASCLFDAYCTYYIQV